MLWKSLGCTWQQQHSLLLKVLTLSLHVSTLSVLSLRSLFWATFSTKGLGTNSTSHKLLYQKQGIEARRLSHSKHWGSGMASTIQRTTQEYHCKIFSFYFATTPPINKNKTQIISTVHWENFTQQHYILLDKEQHLKLQFEKLIRNS